MGSEVKELGCPRIREQVCKPNSVHREPRTTRSWAIIPLGRTLPDGSSDLPGGVARSQKERAFGRAALCPPPYLVLHREEFAWPRLSPDAPVRSYFKPRRAAPFHPSPAALRPKTKARWLVSSLLHLSSHGVQASALAAFRRPAPRR